MSASLLGLMVQQGNLLGDLPRPDDVVTYMGKRVMCSTYDAPRNGFVLDLEGGEKAFMPPEHVERNSNYVMGNTAFQAGATVRIENCTFAAGSVLGGVSPAAVWPSPAEMRERSQQLYREGGILGRVTDTLTDPYGSGGVVITETPEPLTWPEAWKVPRLSRLAWTVLGLVVSAEALTWAGWLGWLRVLWDVLWWHG